jgi:hypothetical protein
MKNNMMLTCRQLSLALALSIPVAYAQIPANGICNTGLTLKAPPLVGCTTSTLVNPINPLDGGSIVDGNWDLAEPYPSVPYTQGPPDPCTFATAYGPAPVSTPWNSWFNPDDQLSQWIEPNGGGSTPPGWYIYRIRFSVPPAHPGYPYYTLEIPGQLMVDNYIAAIYLQDFVNGESRCGPVATFTKSTQFSGWSQFKISSLVVPSTVAYLYFVTINTFSSTPFGNPTGLRVEFEGPTFTRY